MGRAELDGPVPGTGQRLDDALLAPTRVYVRAAEALWEAGVTPRGLVHISGGGLLNLARLAADVSYSLDALPPAPPVFALIAEAGRVPAGHDVRHLQHGHRLLRRRLPVRGAGRHGRAEERGRGSQSVAGSVTGRPGRYVSIPPAGLLGHGEAFTPGGRPPQTPPAASGD